MMGFFMLIFCQTIMLNFFIKRFYVNLKEEFIREVSFIAVIKKDTVLFFDMDGTLVDTDYANFLAYKQAISETVKFDFNVEYDPNFRLTRNSLTAVAPFLSETEYHRIVEKKEELYNNYLHEIQVCKEKVSVIFEYAKYNKIVLVTNSSSNRAMTILNYFGLTEYFDEIFCQESMGRKNKVNKFQNAIEKLGICPNRVIAFENEESEVLLALKAGIEIINPKVDEYNAKI